MIQTPAPGTRLLKFCGDTLKFTLTLAGYEAGTAWVRTNIGNARVIRDEIIRSVDQNKAPLAKDWYDIPMVPAGEGKYRATLPLSETGHFEGKCYFAPDGGHDPVWPEGANVEINVAPAHTCGGNTIYNAFVRQFGANKEGRLDAGIRGSVVRELDREGYTVIPPSGTFRDLMGELDFIIGTLGCRIIQLLPVHPTPTTYARMGRFGSPYAALSFTQVDPALAEFDPKATPLDQFIELVDAVHRRNAAVFIDIAINHTGWAASLHETHPQWLARDPKGEIEVPGAWGVRWADLTRLDYHHTELWQYMAGIFITWCKRGVDGFRCDAGYMIPEAAWTYIIASVRQQFPDAVFVLEGLGGKISVTRALLNRSGFDWAYSELFQNYDRHQIEHYLPESIDISNREGTTVHFAETHDNNRLAARSISYAKMRTALCALLSHHGAFGFANGVEWHATEKIDVHDATSLNWSSENNQVDAIRRLNGLLAGHPVFFDGAAVSMIQKGEGEAVVLFRHHPPSGKRLLIAANLNIETGSRAEWRAGDAGLDGDDLFDLFDLLTQRPVAVEKGVGDCRSLHLSPGQVVCLSPDPEDAARITDVEKDDFAVPERVVEKRLRAVALEVFRVFHGTADLGEFAPERAAAELKADPVGFCRRMNPDSAVSRVIEWQWPRDRKREVMVPPGFFLLVRSKHPFSARVESGDRVLSLRNSLGCLDGDHFALFPPGTPGRKPLSCRLKMTVHSAEKCRRGIGPLLYLASWKTLETRAVFNRARAEERPLLLLGTNRRGGMLRAHARWGELDSRYDALLAANLDPDIPVNRWVMFTRCRAWVVFQGYSQALTVECLTRFRVDCRSRGIWDFKVPTGQGESVGLSVAVEMVDRENFVRISFFRPVSSVGEKHLADGKPVKLILRPDIEDRDFHDTTKAYTGPETDFPKAVTPGPDRFSFAPHPERRLEMTLPSGTFVVEPEWQYMVHRPGDALRGMDPDSDLFSPGYFEVNLTGDHSAVLTAVAVGPEKTVFRSATVGSEKGEMPRLKSHFQGALPDVLDSALDDFVVRRGRLKSVIAGYPWFLDWGRDSLMVVRALIAAGRTTDAREILQQFGRFEERGTLPNMIQGSDAGNRDTSDAPLWFAMACRDLMLRDRRLIDQPCGARTFRDVVISIGHAYVNGTGNGIRVDPDSGLVFSPGHYTWMDTNHPAGTPRQGYPVEIQALWYATLQLLEEIDDRPRKERWKILANRVKRGLSELFWNAETGYLADCLHGSPGTTAIQAVADDALRPNQILAVTTGAVTETGMCRKILDSCQELLVPGGIRSLADRQVRISLDIRHNGQRLNDPYHPYKGRYEGEEDTRRKPAYHNGTAWTWPFPSFCEAWAEVYDKPGRDTALNWLGSAAALLNSGCVGHLPEILDGDAPHLSRGCDAQAWGASELLRVWIKLTEPHINGSSK